MVRAFDLTTSIVVSPVRVTTPTSALPMSRAVTSLHYCSIEGSLSTEFLLWLGMNRIPKKKPEHRRTCISCCHINRGKAAGYAIPDSTFLPVLPVG